LLARSILEDDPALPARHLRPTVKPLDARLERSMRRAHIEYFSIYDATCPRGNCTLWAEPGVPALIDAHHLSLAGAKLVLGRLGPKLFD
jgi:hypothetical protein